jgi:hypothetical protein
MEPRRFWGPVVADLHHFDEDPDPNQNEKLDPDLHYSDANPPTMGGPKYDSIQYILQECKIWQNQPALIAP